MTAGSMVVVWSDDSQGETVGFFRRKEIRQFTYNGCSKRAGSG